MPTAAAGNGYVKMRATTNTTSPGKRTGHVTINGTAYTVVQGGCGSTCTGILDPPPSATLRVMQYNLHHGGWGTDGVYSPARIVDWIAKANPDVISFNEIEIGDSWSQNQDQTAIYQTLIEQRTGVTWYKVYVNAAGAKTGIGNAVFSKYPFVATASLLLPASRAAVDATIAVNGRTINVTSVHMDNVSEANRLTEVADVLPWEATFAEERIICGDFNAWPAASEITKMKADYVETWTAAQAAGSAIGNGITHGSHQIDYVFLSKAASHLALKSMTIFNTADANGVMPSDHNPVLVVFEVR
jgi:endonuclease/exonuclease/phosphatase family metal-dependent hydrolase